MSTLATKQNLPVTNEDGPLKEKAAQSPRPAHVLDAVCCAGVFFFSVFYRFLTSDFVELGGDAIQKWQLLKIFVNTGKLPADLVIDHHALRWGLNIPVAVIQYLFGTQPENYYIFPILIASIGAVAVFEIVRRLDSRLPALFAALAFIVHPQMVRDGSQFLPSGPQAAYLLIAILLLVIWMDRPKWRLIVLSSLFAFFAYGAKETSLLWLPFFPLVIAWGGLGKGPYYGLKNVRAYVPALVFLAGFTFLYAVEHLSILYLLGEPLGRLGVIRRVMKDVYQTQGGWKESYSLVHWIMSFHYRLAHLQDFNRLTLNLGLLCSVASLFVFRDKKARVPAAAFLYGYLMQIYGITGAFPFRYAERSQARYFITLYALSIVVVILLAFCLKQQIVLSPSREQRRVEVRLAVIVGVLFAGYFAATSIKSIATCDSENSMPGVLRVRTFERLFAEAKEGRLPVIFVTNQYPSSVTDAIYKKINDGNYEPEFSKGMRVLQVLFQNPEVLMSKRKQPPILLIGAYTQDKRRLYAVVDANGVQGTYKGKYLAFIQSANDMQPKWDSREKGLEIP